MQIFQQNFALSHWVPGVSPSSFWSREWVPNGYEHCCCCCCCWGSCCYQIFNCLKLFHFVTDFAHRLMTMHRVRFSS